VNRLGIPLAASLFIGLSACGGTPPVTEAPPSAPEAAPATSTAPPVPAPAPEAAGPNEPPATPAEPAAAAPPSIDWAGMTREQRLEHMKTVVMPKMKELMVAFDPKEFGDMKCPTCHGDGAKDKTFKMPNPKLPKLSFTDGFKKHMAKKPEITKFMMEKVVPEMATLLGTQPYDPKTQKGFGCAGCHVVGP
jgi:hypothetical protein